MSKYTLSREAKIRAEAGDLQYFLDLKEHMGEKSFHEFVKNQIYRNSSDKNYVQQYAPNNLLLSKALLHNKTEVAKFLIENGADVQTKNIKDYLLITGYSTNHNNLSVILEAIISAGVDLLQAPYTVNYRDVTGIEKSLFEFTNSLLTNDDVKNLAILREYFNHYNYDAVQGFCRLYIDDKEDNDRTRSQAVQTGAPKSAAWLVDNDRNQIPLSRIYANYLKNNDWTLYQAVQIGAPKCAAWLVEHGASVNAEVYSYVKRKKRLRISDYIYFKAAEILQNILMNEHYTQWRNHCNDESFFIQIPNDEAYDNAVNVIKTLRTKSSLKNKFGIEVFMSMLQQSLRSSPAHPAIWNPVGFMNPLRAFCLCWTVMNCFTSAELKNIKDTYGRNIEWYLSNILHYYKKDYTDYVNLRDKNSSIGMYIDEEIYHFSFTLMEKFARTCQLKYETITNIVPSTNANCAPVFVYDL